MSRRASEVDRRQGFTLVEVLVALVVAGLFLAAFSRAFAVAWGGARKPMEVVSAMTLARTAALARSTGEVAGPARAMGYSVERMVGTVEVAVLPSPVAPAPVAVTPSKPDSKVLPGLPAANTQMPGVTHGAPASGGADGPSRLLHVTVNVRTPSDRNIAFETVRLVHDGE